VCPRSTPGLEAAVSGDFCPLGRSLEGGDFAPHVSKLVPTFPGAAERGWAGVWMGLGAVGMARAGDASPSIEASGGEGCEGAGRVPAALAVSAGFPWVVDGELAAPRSPPMPLALSLHFPGPAPGFAP